MYIAGIPDNSLVSFFMDIHGVNCAIELRRFFINNS